METRIQKTLNQWFPEAFTGIENSALNSDYEVLRHFARYTKTLINIDSDIKSEPFRIINLLYFNGTLFEKNAIENEFFTVLAYDENPCSIKEHLHLMPNDLRPIYLKIILEN